MADNVIRLPRPRATRPTAEGLGFFLRVGHNDHKELLELLAAGEKSIFGFVIEAQNVRRHRDLIAEARRRNLDVILDPKTQQMALPGGHTARLAQLPWGRERPHTLADFDGDEGRALADALVAFAVEHRFTQLLLPTHILSGPNDQWLRRDIEMSSRVAQAVRRQKAELDLIYSIALPLAVLRNRAERDALVHALEDAEMSELWLRVEHFGADASGEKTVAFIEAAREFHRLQKPLVADNAGGLPAVAALAFGAVGGIAHGVTLNESFNAGRWRIPPKDDVEEEEADGEKKKRGPGWRVYLSHLDMFMKRADAEAFLSLSPRVKGKHACRDTNCCPRGMRDMVARPARHAIYQRAREIDWLSNTPQGLRAATYVEDRVRKVSDDVAAAASLAGLSEATQKALKRKQVATSRFRQAVGNLVEEARSSSVAIVPRRRSAR